MPPFYLEHAMDENGRAEYKKMERELEITQEKVKKLHIRESRIIERIHELRLKKRMDVRTLWMRMAMG